MGEIPADWKVVPLAAVSRERREKNIGLREDNLLSLSFGRIVRKDIESNDGLLPESFETYQVVREDDLVFRFTDLQNDKRSLRSAIATEVGIITSAYLALRPTGVHPPFLAYLMRAYDAQKVFYSMGGGLRQSLKFDDVKRLPVILPSAVRQTEIVEYLDVQTAKIDALIARQEKLISVLQERRQVLIDHAFAKSELTRERRLRSLLEGRPTYGVLVPIYTGSDEDVPFIRVGDLATLHAATPSARISEAQSAEYSRTRITGGEVLLGVVGKMGQVAIAPNALRDANVARAVAVLRCSDRVTSELMSIWLTSTAFLDQAAVATSGDSVQPTLGMADLAAMSVMWPIDPAQAAGILRQLKHDLALMDKLKAKTEQFIALSKERRQALISAAVTGKIDVRGLA